jgi:hypothetical protein
VSFEGNYFQRPSTLSGEDMMRIYSGLHAEFEAAGITAPMERGAKVAEALVARGHARYAESWGPDVVYAKFGEPRSEVQ